MTTDHNLPPGWVATTLGEVIDYANTAKVEPEVIPGDAWVLELEDIEKDSSKILQRLTFSERKSKSTKNRFERGDVLYGKLRPYLNKVVVADAPGYCTTEIVPLKPNGKVEGRYLYYWLKHPEFLEYVTGVSHGLNMPRLGTEAGKKAPFILAPLAEQKRIADKLDRLLAAVDTCKAHLDAIPTILKRFRQSVLAAATSGDLSDESKRSGSDTWEAVRFGSILKELRNGLAPKPREEPPGIPILRISAVRPGEIDELDVRYLETDQTTIDRYRLRPDDLLFTRYNGTLEFVGVCAVYRGSSETAVLYPDKLIRARFDTKRVLPKFAEIWFSAPSQRSAIEGLVRSSAGQKGISGADLKGLLIRLPPLAEQQKIVRKVVSLFTLVAELEAKVGAYGVQLKSLMQGLLIKAFRGALSMHSTDQEQRSAMVEDVADAISRQELWGQAKRVIRK